MRRTVTKKVFFSILASIVVFVTMFATTYAWVGIFTYSSASEFGLNVKNSKIGSDYYLTISKTGEIGTFADALDEYDIKKEILGNIKETDYSLEDNQTIGEMWAKNKINPVTTTLNSDGTFGQFKRIELENNSYNVSNSTSYFKFTFYLSVDTREGITSTTNVSSSVMIDEITSVFSGTSTIGKTRLYNGNPYLDETDSSYAVLKTIPQKDAYYIDSRNAARIALQIYDPVDINGECDSTTPFTTYIYQGGKNEPSVSKDEKGRDVYNLGGCLDMDHNLAANQLLVLRPDYKYAPAFSTDLEAARNRNLVEMTLTEDNALLWNKDANPTKYLGVKNGLQTKMKVVCYFWYEGWDADCIKGIEQLPIDINLSFIPDTGTE